MEPTTRDKDQPATDSQIVKFIMVCRQYRKQYGQMPACLAREWVQAHPRRHHAYNGAIKITDRSTGEVVAIGTVAECAEQMGRSLHSLRSTISSVNRGINSKWQIEEIGENTSADGQDDRTETE